MSTIIRLGNGEKSYPSIRAWGAYMGSFDYYIQNEIANAKRVKAPEDAIYERDGKWIRLSDVTSDTTRAYFEMAHPELFKKYMAH